MTENSYSEGFAACRRGEAIHVNPYAIFTVAHVQWESGWLEYDRHQNAKDEALDSIGWNGA